jgi:hypothetical protein
MTTETQTELAMYFDISPYIFNQENLILLKKFQVEAFPFG